jgi:hypothetical protein
MSHRRDLKYLRRAQKQAKRQMRQLTKLELTGLTAVTLHAHNRQVTVTLVSATGAPFTDALRQALRERRQALQAEARQLLITWQEDEQLCDRPVPSANSLLP